MTIHRSFKQKGGMNCKGHANKIQQAEPTVKMWFFLGKLRPALYATSLFAIHVDNEVVTVVACSPRGYPLAMWSKSC